LIPIHSEHPISPPINVSYSNNILILDPKSFLDFFGFDNYDRIEFLDVINSSIKSIWGSKEHIDLLDIYLGESVILEEKFSYSNKEFSNYIDKKEMEDILDSKGEIDSYMNLPT
jgi:hypothetical protein